MTSLILTINPESISLITATPAGDAVVYLTQKEADHLAKLLTIVREDMTVKAIITGADRAGG